MAKKKQLKVSETIEEFENFLNTLEELYVTNYNIVGNEDKKTQSFLHEIEMADYKTRCRLTTKLGQSRKARRQAKDVVLVTEPVVEFLRRKENQKVLRYLFSQVKQIVRNQENYVNSERTYEKALDEFKLDRLNRQ